MYLNYLSQGHDYKKLKGWFENIPTKQMRYGDFPRNHKGKTFSFRLCI